MDKEFYIYLSSNKQAERNVGNDFLVRLPETIKLDGKWLCALTEFSYSNEVKQTFYVCTNICEDTIVSSKRYPVLRRFIPPSQIKTALPGVTNTPYVLVKQAQIDSVRIF